MLIGAGQAEGAPTGHLSGVQQAYGPGGGQRSLRAGLPGVSCQAVWRYAACLAESADCGVAFTGREASRRHHPSWEHITNDARIITRENIARCSIGCNSSKGKKTLIEWLTSEYCAARGITGESVASVVRSYLASNRLELKG